MAALKKSVRKLSLIRRLRSLPRYLKDPAVSTWKKLALGAAVVYILSPLDGMPDWIPLLGWLDDLGVLGLASGWLLGELGEYRADSANREVERVETDE